MKKLIFLILAAGVVYLNYTNPTREDHEELLLTELQAIGPVSDEQFETLLKSVDYINLMVCSATKPADGSKMISLGYLNQTRVISEKWFQDTAAKLQGRQGN